MGNREKLEIPTIEFTPVTLLSAPTSTCACPKDKNSGEGTGLGCVDNFDEDIPGETQ